MSIVIRSVEEKDISKVYRIETESYPDPWPNSIFYLIYGRSRELFIVAEGDKLVLGYAIGELEKFEATLIGHIINLAVDPPWRRKGLGVQLLGELEQRFKDKGADHSYLEVRTSNSLAQRLYKKMGYMITKILVNYYGNEDGYQMEKHLKH